MGVYFLNISWGWPPTVVMKMISEYLRFQEIVVNLRKFSWGLALQTPQWKGLFLPHQVQILFNRLSRFTPKIS